MGDEGDIGVYITGSIFLFSTVLFLAWEVYDEIIQKRWEYNKPIALAFLAFPDVKSLESSFVSKIDSLHNSYVKKVSDLEKELGISADNKICDKGYKISLEYKVKSKSCNKMDFLNCPKIKYCEKVNSESWFTSKLFKGIEYYNLEKEFLNLPDVQKIINEYEYGWKNVYSNYRSKMWTLESLASI
jgi:hypothetical protein